MLTIRPSHPEEIPRMKELWKKCFGDPENYIDLFYRAFCDPEQALVVVEDGEINAMGTVLPGELCFPDGSAVPVGYIYALATIPDRQGQGHARQLLQYAGRHIQAQGGKALVLVPASASLHRYFEAVGLQECFAIREVELLNSALNAAEARGSMRPIPPEDYNRRREELLQGSFHLRYPDWLIAYQRANSRLTGGELYRLELEEGSGVAAVEYPDQSSLLVKELLIAPEAQRGAVELLVRETGVNRCYVRTPALWEGPKGSYIQAFGMIQWYDRELQRSYGGDQEAYLGLAFD